MIIHFATCSRASALGFIRRVYPGHVDRVMDTPDSAGTVLDFVERDVIRIQDPMMHGSTIAIVPGNSWNECHRKAVTDACAAMVKYITDGGAA